MLVAAAGTGLTLSGAQAQKADTSAIYTYQGADRDQRLVAAAKKEGTVTFYTSMQTQESGPLSKAFEQKYGIRVQLWRATSDQVIQRTVNEARAGRQALDILETNAPEVDAIGREDIVAPFYTPHSCRPAGLGEAQSTDAGTPRAPICGLSRSIPAR